MKYKFSEEELKEAIKNATSWIEVCKTLNTSTITSYQSFLKKKGEKLNIDFSHFLGRTSNEGRPLRTDIAEFFSNEKPINGSTLRRLLIKNKLKEEKCEICNLTTWNSKIIPLELHHIDQNHFNNNIDNLQILCSNCHSQLTTEYRLNLKKSKPVKEKKIRLPRKIKLTGRVHTRKIVRPELNILLKDVENLGYRGTGRKYNVSDSSIREWIRLYNKYVSVV